MKTDYNAPRAPLLTLSPIVLALLLAGCGGDAGDGSAFTTPLAAPTGVGAADTAPVQDEAAVLPFVDYAYTNQRGYAQYATLATNAGVRVVSGFLALWTPSTEIVDAGVTAAAVGSFPAVTTSTWTGIPGSASDGKAVNASVLAQNVAYVASATGARTADQATAAYLDDRRNKGYSVTDGLGPLTAAWRSAAQQTTTITGVAADATTVLYNDGGNNLGVGSAAGNTAFGAVVDFVGSPLNASTEPAKRFYKYARPFRWSAGVSVVPALVPAESATPATDGGYISGHAAEASRDALAMAYVLPERYQEMIARALELGENRILAGMHSPLDVIAGRIQAQAVLAATLYAQQNKSTKTPAAANGSTAEGTATVADLRATAYAQAHTALMAAAGTSDEAAFMAYAHSATTATDRFADHAANAADYLRRLTYGFAPVADTTQAAVVPKGAELLLETRLPYLSADQRRVVLKSTALASGFPAMDDAEGWGRLNLFAAADGYGSFNGDVSVTMDASQGGFAAEDSWRNDISGKGLLTLAGTGTLHLTGANTYSGGTIVAGGTLQADSTSALGTGDVYQKAGTLVCAATQGQVLDGGNYVELAGATLQLDLGGADKGTLLVSLSAQIAGTLNVSFVNGYKPAVGDTIAVLSAHTLSGRFSQVNVQGFKATTRYSATGVTVHLDAAA
jgi:autotransporter-associated beta strand protein